VSAMSTLLRRGAFAVMMVFGVLALGFVLGTIAEDPGGWAAVALSAVVLVPILSLSVVAVRTPELATRTLVVGVGLLAGYAVVEAFVPLPIAGPVVAVGTVVLAVPMAVLGLRHAREAGMLLVLDGLVPVLGLALVALQHADEGSRGLHLGGSSGAAGVPVLLVGALFLLAWVAELQPAAGHRRAGPRHA
jgi:hypothetical protein